MSIAKRTHNSVRGLNDYEKNDFENRNDEAVAEDEDDGSGSLTTSHDSDWDGLRLTPAKESWSIDEACQIVSQELVTSFTNLPYAAPLVRYMAKLLHAPDDDGARSSEYAWHHMKGTPFTAMIARTVAGATSLKWLIQYGYLEDYLSCLRFCCEADVQGALHQLTFNHPEDLTLLYSILILPGRVIEMRRQLNLSEGINSDDSEADRIQHILDGVVAVAVAFMRTAATARQVLIGGVPSPIRVQVEMLHMIPEERKSTRLRVVRSLLQTVLATMECTREWMDHFARSSGGATCVKTCTEWVSIPENASAPLDANAEVLFDVMCLALAAPDVGCRATAPLYEFLKESQWRGTADMRRAGVEGESSDSSMKHRYNRSLLSRTVRDPCDLRYDTPVCQFGFRLLTHVCLLAQKSRPVLFVYLARLLLRVVHHSYKKLVLLGLISDMVIEIIRAYMALATSSNYPLELTAQLLPHLDPRESTAATTTMWRDSIETIHNSNRGSSRSAPMSRARATSRAETGGAESATMQRDEEPITRRPDDEAFTLGQPTDARTDDLSGVALDVVGLCASVCNSSANILKQKSGSDELCHLVVELAVHTDPVVMRSTLCALAVLPAMTNEPLLFGCLVHVGLFGAVLQRLKHDGELPEKLLLLRMLRRIHTVVPHLQTQLVEQADGIAVLMRRVAGISQPCMECAADIFSATQLNTAEGANRVCSNLANLVIPCDWEEPAAVSAACWSLQCIIRLVARETAAKVYFSRLVPSILENLKSLTPFIATLFDRLCSAGERPDGDTDQQHRSRAYVMVDLTQSYDHLWELQRHDKNFAEKSVKHHYLLLNDVLLLHLHVVSHLLVRASPTAVDDACPRMYQILCGGPLLLCRLYTSIVARATVGFACWSSLSFLNSVAQSSTELDGIKCGTGHKGLQHAITLQKLNCGWDLRTTEGDALFAASHQRLVCPQFIHVALRAFASASKTLPQALTSISVMDLVINTLSNTAENCYALAEVELLTFAANQLAIITRADKMTRLLVARYLSRRIKQLGMYGLSSTVLLYLTELCLTESTTTTTTIALSDSTSPASATDRLHQTQRQGQGAASLAFNERITSVVMNTWDDVLRSSLPINHPTNFIGINPQHAASSRFRSLCAPVARYRSNTGQVGGIDVPVTTGLWKTQSKTSKKISLAMWVHLDDGDTIQVSSAPGSPGQRSPRHSNTTSARGVAREAQEESSAAGGGEKQLRDGNRAGDDEFSAKDENNSSTYVVPQSGETALISLFFDETRICLQVCVNNKRRRLSIRQSVSGVQQVRTKVVTLSSLPLLPLKQWCLLTLNINGLTVSKGSLRAKLVTTVEVMVQYLPFSSRGVSDYMCSETVVRVETNQGVTDRSYNAVKELSFVSIGTTCAMQVDKTLSVQPQVPFRLMIGSAVVFHGEISRLESLVLFALGSDQLFSMTFLDRSAVVHQYPLLCTLLSRTQGHAVLKGDLSVLASMWLQLCEAQDDAPMVFTGPTVPFSKGTRDRIAFLFGVRDNDVWAAMRVEEVAPTSTLAGFIPLPSAPFGALTAANVASSPALLSGPGPRTPSESSGGSHSGRAPHVDPADRESDRVFASLHASDSQRFNRPEHGGDGGADVMAVAKRKRLTFSALQISTDDSGLDTWNAIGAKSLVYRVHPVRTFIETVGGAPFFLWLSSFQKGGSHCQILALRCATTILSLHCGAPLRNAQETGGFHLDSLLSAMLHMRISISPDIALVVTQLCGTSALVRADLLPVMMDFTLWSQSREALRTVFRALSDMLGDPVYGYLNTQLLRHGVGHMAALSGSYAIDELLLHLHMYFSGDTHGDWDVSLIPDAQNVLLKLASNAQHIGRIIHSALWLVTEELNASRVDVRMWAFGLLDVARQALENVGPAALGENSIHTIVSDTVSFFKSTDADIRCMAFQIIISLGFTADDSVKIVAEYKARRILFQDTVCIHRKEVASLLSVIAAVSKDDVALQAHPAKHIAFLLVALLPIMSHDQKVLVLNTLYDSISTNGALCDLLCSPRASTPSTSSGFAVSQDALNSPLQFHLFAALTDLGLEVRSVSAEAQRDAWETIERIASIFTTICRRRIWYAAEVASVRSQSSSSSSPALARTQPTLQLEDITEGVSMASYGVDGRGSHSLAAALSLDISTLIENCASALIGSVTTYEDLERFMEPDTVSKLQRIVFSLALHCVSQLYSHSLKSASLQFVQDILGVFQLLTNFVFLFGWDELEDETGATTVADSAYTDSPGDSRHFGPLPSMDLEAPAFTHVQRYFRMCFGDVPSYLHQADQAWRALPFFILEASQRLAFELRVTGATPAVPAEEVPKLVSELLLVQWRLATFLLGDIGAGDEVPAKALAMLHLVGAGGVEYGYGSFSPAESKVNEIVTAPKGGGWTEKSFVFSPHCPLMQTFTDVPKLLNDLTRESAPWLLLLHAAAGYMYQPQEVEWNEHRARMGQSLTRLILYNSKVWGAAKGCVSRVFFADLEAQVKVEGTLRSSVMTRHQYADMDARHDREFTRAGLSSIHDYITGLRSKALVQLQHTASRLLSHHPTLLVDPRRAVQLHNYINTSMQQLQTTVWKSANFYKKMVEDDGYAILAAHAAPRFALLPWWGNLNALYTNKWVPLARWELDRVVGPDWQRVRLRRLIHDTKMFSEGTQPHAFLQPIAIPQSVLSSVTDDVTLLQSFSITAVPQVLTKRVLRSDSAPLHCQLILPMDRVPILFYISTTTISYVVEWFQHTLETERRQTQFPTASEKAEGAEPEFGGGDSTEVEAFPDVDDNYGDNNEDERGGDIERHRANASDSLPNSINKREDSATIAGAVRRSVFATPYDPSRRIPPGFRYQHEIPCFRRVIDISSIRAVWPRRNLLQPTAVEILLESGETLFVAFNSEVVRKKTIETLVSLTAPYLDKTLAFTDSNLKTWRNWWLDGRISNFKYLMYLNMAAGRSYGDLRQYPVFPHVLADYTSPDLNLTDPSSFRILEKPMGAQTEEREDRVIAKFNEMVAIYDEMMDDGFTNVDLIPHHYGSHYSPLGGALHYLVRLQPFADYFLDMNTKLDDAGRVFESMATAYSISSTGKDVKELVPEFYCQPQMYINANRIPFGTKQDGSIVDDVVLPMWAGTSRQFATLMREALESRYVSERLCSWIDLVFGYKQKGRDAVTAVNVFHALTYSGTVDLSTVEDRVLKASYSTQIDCFGQTPLQLFTQAHRPRVKPTDSMYAQTPCPTVRFDSSQAKNCLLARIECAVPGSATRVDVPSSSSGVVVAFCRSKSSTAALGAGETGDWLSFTPTATRPSTFPVGSVPFTIVNDQAKDLLLFRGGNLVVVDSKDLSKELACFHITSSTITCCAVDANTVFVGTACGAIHVVTISQEEVNEVELEDTTTANGEKVEGQPKAVAASSSSRVELVAVGDVRIVRTRTSVLRRVCVFYGHTTAVVSLCPSPEWGVVVSAGDDGIIAVWDTRRHVLVRTIPTPDSHRAFAAGSFHGIHAANGGGAAAASGGGSGLTGRRDASSESVANGAGGAAYATNNETGSTARDSQWFFDKIAVNAREGDIIVAGSSVDGRAQCMRLYSLNGELISECSLDDEPAGALLTVGELAFVGRCNGVEVYNARTLQPVHSLTHNALSDVVMSLSLNPTASVLAAGDRQGNVVTWKAA